MKKSTAVFPVPIDPRKQNPFLVHPLDFKSGGYLPLPQNEKINVDELPEIKATDSDWFGSQDENSLFPRIFMIGGHHEISRGFHNQAEDKFIYTPTLYETVKKYPAARGYFDKVKLAIVFGCNTLTNLEPHHKDGSVMTIREIRSLYFSGAAGKKAVIGTADTINTLEFYRSRLLREYGKHSKEFAYTRDPKKELCYGPGKYENCKIENIDRIFPDTGLFDGSRRYNDALNMRRLFRNAYLVVGFSSASPAEEVRVKIFKKSVEIANVLLNLSPGSDVISQIISRDTADDVRKDAIEAFRRAWEESTFTLNRGRPSGAITPFYPELDRQGVVLQRFTNDSQIYAPYR